MVDESTYVAPGSFAACFEVSCSELASVQLPPTVQHLDTG